MDLYTGELSPLDITREIIEYLDAGDLLNEDEYLSWISSSASSYRQIELIDGSTWVLSGKKAGRYVHIHPGRYSSNTLRIRSETLKTAIAVLCYCSHYKKHHSDINLINQVRISLLNLSPLKEVSPGRGLGKLIRILSHMK